MATYLTPDKIRTEYGLTIKEKILPDGNKNKPNRKLTSGSPKYITIHNTDRIVVSSETTCAEQYVRATFNGNMGGVSVHYYIDDKDCWQMLAEDEIGYHAADGYSGTGNTQSLAIEIIMDGSGKDYDAAAEKRGALLAAILLYRHNLTIDKMVTHNHWYSKKYCPAYILPHWSSFVNTVQFYLNSFKSATSDGTSTVVVKKNYLTYPTKIMNITQGYTGNYTHGQHSSGSPADYPIDEACADSGRDYFYCPCDEMQIAHIYGFNNSKKTNTLWLQSTSKVDLANGSSDYVTILVTHPNDDDLSQLKEGQKFTRGQKMFREGNDGNATGYHFHIAVGTGKWLDPGWVQNSNGSWVHKSTGVQLKPENAFYLDKSFTTIKNAAGLSFKNVPEEKQESGADSNKIYRVQVGAFAIKENAEVYLAKIKDAGFEGFIKQSDKLYRIQCGAYSIRKNAETLLKELKAKGFEAFIVEEDTDDNIIVKPRIKGDIDGDGKVTASDARLALRAAVGLEVLDAEQIEAGDMDDDGKITSSDARDILRKSVGLG